MEKLEKAEDFAEVLRPNAQKQNWGQKKKQNKNWGLTPNTRPEFFFSDI